MPPTLENRVTRRTFLASGAAAVLAASAGARTSSGVRRSRIGLLGPGRHGTSLLRAIESIGPRFGAAIVAVHRDSLDALLSANVDGVIIATPDHMHAKTSATALDAGLHVYCAAPMGHTESDAAAVRAAAGESQCVYHLGMDSALEPHWQAARALVQSGVIGDVRWCSATASPDRSFGSLDWKTNPACTNGPAARAVHDLWAAMAYVTGAREPIAVTAMGGAFEPGSAMPDALSVSADFDNGLHFNLDCNPARRTTAPATIRGSLGSLVVEHDRICAMPESLGGSVLHEVWRRDNAGLQTALEAWLSAVRNGALSAFSPDWGYFAACGSARAAAACLQNATASANTRECTDSMKRFHMDR